ncbi:MAG TPA: transketolase [Anaerolineae bacterium]|nr:transketolase [Anaerolineae bacterium]HIQ12441.1 transketolase [Caldilineales bacterium]
MTYDHTDQLVANTLRLLAVDAIQAANSGHPGLPLGAADVAIVLWTRFLKHDPADPAWPDRDRFILSAGHGSALLYALLHLFGYPITMEDLQHFRQWGYITAGHPEYDPKLGIEITTGPLGQGISNAVGMALAERWLAARFNKSGFKVMDHYTYVLAGDGDLMEGVSHEAASLAGHWGLGKLIVLYDDNHISIDGPTEIAFTEDVLARFEAYGWHVQRVDGHDMAAVDGAIRAAQAEAERPSIIACRTHIGYGSPRQDTAKVHGEPLGPDGVRETKRFFGFPEDEAFYIPEEVWARVEAIKAAGAAAHAQWREMMAAYRQAHPELAQEWDLFVHGELPAGWEQYLPNFTGEKPLATRATSGKVLDAILPHLPMVLGGSADLTSSNKTKPKDAKAIQRGDFGGNYIHYGVREHGMAAIMNGLATHYVRPYGGTFLVFSDYMRGALRVTALMNLPVVFVFTHDSIGLGEDGPTHQPIEHLMALRAMPNLTVIRPADGNETAQAWKVALERRGPTALILSRQGLPQITPKDNQLARGAYILADPLSGDPDIVLIATGSEVALALDAVDALLEQGVTARVVSMPSWELFDRQDEAYRASVLPPDKPKLAIEAGATLGWARYVGLNGDVIGIDRFGASAPGKLLFEKYGFIMENVVARALALLEK